MTTPYYKNQEYYKNKSLEYYYNNRDERLDYMRKYNKLYYMKTVKNKEKKPEPKKEFKPVNKPVEIVSSNVKEIIISFD